MNELQIFSSEQFGKIRAVEVNGDPWFCLADVCKPLGLQAWKCKDRLKPDGLLTMEGVDSVGRRNTLLWCNEGNLYRAIFQSKKPEAEAFTDWVTEEVLPALRKHGTYSTVPQKRISLPDGVSLSGLAKLLSVTRRAMLDAGSTPKDICNMIKETYEAVGFPVPSTLQNQIPGQTSLFDQPALGAAT